MKQTGYFLLSILLSPPFPLWALEVPSEYGQVYEKLIGTNAKTLVLIQEAHVDYGAQKAMVEILKNLIEKDSLHLILVEGGWDDMGLSYLRTYGNPKGRLEIAERYLKEGKISGEEYLDITSDLDFQLWGIENPEFYAENMEAFLKFHDGQEKLLSEFAPLEASLKPVKEKLLPTELLRLEKKKEDLEEKKISFLSYFSFLRNMKKGNFSDFPLLQKLAAVTGIEEGGVDPEKAEWEKQSLIRALSRKLTKPELERFRLLETRKTPGEEAAFVKSLLEACEKDGNLRKTVSVENLRRYAKALEEMEGLDPRKLSQETETFERKTIEALLFTPEQKEFYRFLEAWRILKRLFELKLTPEEFERMEKYPADFQFSRWRGFLQEKTDELGEIEKKAPQAKAFYLSARKREQALIENTVKKIESENSPLTALIIGGFHTERFVEALKEKGYTLFVVAPRFTPGDPKVQNQHYFEILKYKWESGPSAAAAPSQKIS